MTQTHHITAAKHCLAPVNLHKLPDVELRPVLDALFTYLGIPQRRNAGARVLSGQTDIAAPDNRTENRALAQTTEEHMRIITPDMVMHALQNGGGLMAIPTDGNSAPKPLPEAQIAELRHLLAIYIEHLEKCPFQRGDLITPRANSSLKGSGHPCIVLEVNDAAQPQFGSQRSGNTWGIRPNIRILCLCEDHYAAFWTESYEYDRYQEKP